MSKISDSTFLFSIRNMRNNNDLFSLLVGAYVFCWFTQIGKRIVFLGAIRFELILGALLTLVSLYVLSTRRTSKSSSPYPTPAIYGILLILYYGIFVLFSQDPDTSWSIYFNRVLKFSLLALFIYALADNAYKIALVLFCYFLAAAKAGQEGLIGLVTGNMVWENQGIPRLHGSIDMYGHPNSFSGFAVCLLPFIYCFYPIMNRYMKLALIFLFICAVAIILFTGSRTGYIATVFFVIYVLIKLLKRHFLRFIVLVSVISVASMFLLPPEYKARFGTIFSQQDQEGGSTTARKQILYDGLDIWLDHPFGVGVGAFPKVRNEMFGRSQDTHNLYLEILTNTGFLGLIIFLLFIKAIIRTNQRIILLNVGSASSQSKFLAALAGATIGYIYARLFLGLFGMDMYEIYWWFALGLTCANFKLNTR